MDLKEIYEPASEAMPGTRPDSTITALYERLRAGEVLTTLDGVFSDRTVCLGKYISLMRNKYSIPVKDKWVRISEKKSIKRYWLDVTPLKPTANE